MAIFRKINVSFWEDEKIVDDFSPEDRYFYLYLMTNSHTNQAGCYSLTIKQMEFETGYTKDMIISILSKFENDFKIIKYSKETKEILLLNWNRYNWTSSPKVLNCIKKESKNIKNKAYQYYINTLLIPYGYSIDIETQEEQEEEQEEEQQEEQQEEQEERKIIRDIYTDNTIQELKKYYEEKTNNKLYGKKSLELLNNLLEDLDDDVELVKQVIDKSAHKGHKINAEFKPLSFENMVKNANAILNDEYQLIGSGYTNVYGDECPW